MLIKNVTPKQICNLISPAFIALFEKEIEQYIKAEYDKIIESAAKKVASSVSKHIETMYIADDSKIKVNLYIGKSEIQFSGDENE